MQALPWDVPNKNVDESSLTTNLRQISNGYMDEAKAIHKRPGLKVFADLNSGRGTDGSYAWNALAMQIYVSNGNVYKIDSDTGTVTQIATGVMELDNRVSFVEVYDVTNKELRLFLANGGRIYWTNGTMGAYVTGALAPTVCYGLTAIDTYLLCMDNTNPFGFTWSVVGDPTNINGGSASSQLFDDEVLSLGVNNDKIYIFSSSYIEVYYSTGGAVPFEPVPGGVLNYGIASRDATAYLADMIFILNPYRDVVNITNFSMTILSFNYAKYIQQLSVVNDCEMDLIGGYGGRKWLVMTFKDANLTLVYDLVTKAFYEWGTWNGVDDDKLDVRCYSYNSIWGKHLIGSRTTSIIYEMDVNTFNDNGDPIHTEIITGGYQPAGYDYVNSEMTMIDVKRGVGAWANIVQQPATTYNNALLYSMENDTARVDTNVDEYPMIINSRSIIAHQYNNAYLHPANSVLATDGISCKDIVFSFWGYKIDRHISTSHVFMDGNVQITAGPSATLDFGFYDTGLIWNQISWPLTTTTTVRNFIFIINGSSQVASLYIDGVLITPSSSSMTGVDAKLTDITIGSNDSGQYYYDLAILDYNKLLVAGETNASIVSSIYANTALDNGFEFINEFPSNTNVITQSEASFTWQTRDNRENTWSNQIEIPMGLRGDEKLSDPLRNTGRYRTRQHRIIHQDDSEFVLNKIYEKVSHE